LQIQKILTESRDKFFNQNPYLNRQRLAGSVIILAGTERIQERKTIKKLFWRKILTRKVLVIFKSKFIFKKIIDVKEFNYNLG
jgi:hypothetical protein